MAYGKGGILKEVVSELLKDMGKEVGAIQSYKQSNQWGELYIHILLFRATPMAYGSFQARG